MSYFYSEGKPYDGPSINLWGLRPETVARKYMEHFSNFLILNVMSKEKTYSFAERGQMERELTICKRKMTFWERHPNFIDANVKPKKEELIKAWKGRA